MTKLHQKKSQNNQQKSKLWKELSILTTPAENVSKFAPSQHPLPGYSFAHDDEGNMLGLLAYSVGVFFEVGFAGFAQFVVPCFAEAGCQGTFEELVEAQAEFAAERFGRTAYLPAVVVYGYEVGVFSQAERVEVA